MAIQCVFVIHTLKGVYLQETPIPAEVVAYINERIDAALAVNAEKDSSELLFTVFNAERKALFDARIGQTVQAGNAARAEQALQSFNRFVVEYNNIRSRLQAAINYLNRIETNPDQPLLVRYNALALLNEIRDSDSIADAQRALQNYNTFKENLTTSPEGTPITTETPVTPATPINTVRPSLSDENRQYLEEILRILRQFGMNMNDPTVLSFLKKLLLRPTDLKALAADASRLLRLFLQFLG